MRKKTLLALIFFFLSLAGIGVGVFLTKKKGGQELRTKATAPQEGAVHIVLSHLYRALPESGKWEKREVLMRKLAAAGIKYGRESLNWSKITGENCYPGGAGTISEADWHQADWSEYDRVFDLYAKYNITPVVFILATPKQCSHAPAGASDWEKRSFPVLGCKEGERDESEPESEQGNCPKWCSFISAVVQRYGFGPGGKGQVRYWEIWNEPDLKEEHGGGAFAQEGAWWKGSVNDYERLLRVAYKEAKANDPSAMILLGGVTHFALQPGTAEYQWLDSLLNLMMRIRSDKKVYFDIFNFHDYTDRTVDQVAAAKDLLRKYSIDTPIWVTEVSRGGLERADLATRVLPNKVSNLYPAGVEKFFWFMASDMCEEHLMDEADPLAQSGLLDCELNETFLYDVYKAYYLKLFKRLRFP